MSVKIDHPTTTIPLWTDGNGSIRVGSSRVLLELVIRNFNNGESPESIVESFPTLKLSDVYLVTAYYLAHREEIDAYIAWVSQDVERIRRKYEAALTPEEANWGNTLRNRLLKQQKPA